MAGLDKILEEIRKENELEIQNIISKAEAKAKRIIEEKQNGEWLALVVERA